MLNIIDIVTSRGLLCDYKPWNFVSSSILPTSGCSLLKPSWCGVVVSPLLRHTSSRSSVARAAWDTWCGLWSGAGQLQKTDGRIALNKECLVTFVNFI